MLSAGVPEPNDNHLRYFYYYSIIHFFCPSFSQTVRESIKLWGNEIFSASIQDRQLKFSGIDYQIFRFLCFSLLIFKMDSCNFRDCISYHSTYFHKVSLRFAYCLGCQIDSQIYTLLNFLKVSWFILLSLMLYGIKV